MTARKKCVYHVLITRHLDYAEAAQPLLSYTVDNIDPANVAQIVESVIKAAMPKKRNRNEAKGNNESKTTGL
jgi:hypothetical protein